MIKLSIQEIVADFEAMIRYDERLDLLFDFKKADDNVVDEFFTFQEELIKKYIPNYMDLVGDEYMAKDKFDKSLILYNLLYENFKEIFNQLI